MKKLFLLCTLLLLCTLCPAQTIAIGSTAIRQMGGDLRRGDKSTLYTLAGYFSDTTQVDETLGYHLLHMPRKDIAKREVKENTSFLPSEIDIDKAGKDEFTAFLDKYYYQIHYDGIAGVYLITPFDKREVNFEIRAILDVKKDLLKVRQGKLMRLDWVEGSDIKNEITVRDPHCLLLIASHLYTSRSGWDHYYFNEQDDIDLLQLLTGTEIGVEDAKGQLTYLYANDYGGTCYKNLLIYFAKNYTNYTWDNSAGYFVNTKESNNVKSITKEETWFDTMYNNEDDTAALNAFINLTEANPEMVKKLAPGYDKERNFPAADALPTFEERFVVQLAYLTEYCRNNGIDYKNESMRKALQRLIPTFSTFKEKRRVEDSLVNSLTLDNITAFEYWALVYEDNFQLAYSTGYILDKFYSIKFDSLIADKKQLALFLKKSALYNDLGIIGINNFYIKKFTGTGAAAKAQLEALSTTDFDIEPQRRVALALTAWPLPYATYVAEKLNLKDAYTKVNNKYTNKLDKLGVTYKNPDGTLDYDALYELLKYGVVYAFAGGGGGKYEDVANPIVKMLGGLFNTQIGFEGKEGQCYPPCKDRLYNAEDQALKWMHTLKQNNLLKLPHNQPPSLVWYDENDK